MLTIWLLVAISFFGFYTHAEIEKKCTLLAPSHKNLSINKYLGTWYLVKSGPPNDAFPSSECVEESYTTLNHSEHLLNYEFKRKNNGNWEGGKGIAVVKDLSKPGIIDIYDNEGNLHQSLVATDGKNWAIWYVCEEIRINNSIHTYYMLMSRTRTLNSFVEDALTNIIEGFGIQPTDLKLMNQTNCS